MIRQHLLGHTNARLGYIFSLQTIDVRELLGLCGNASASPVLCGNAVASPRLSASVQVEPCLSANVTVEE